jgi:DNA-binding MarR family transcriptional regulator
MRTSERSAAKRNKIYLDLVEDPNDSIGFRLWQVAQRWQRHIGKYFVALGLTHTQYVLLAASHYLAIRREPPTQTALSAFTGIDKMLVSRGLRELEKRGAVARTTHSSDSRALRVELTGAGRRLTRAVSNAAVRAHREFFGGLGSNRAVLAELLGQLIPDEDS